MTTPSTMRALLASDADPTNVRLSVVPIPVPGVDEVLIEVHAAAITSGELEWPETWPAIPAHDVSGVIVAVGMDSGLQVGEAVVGLIDFDRAGAAAQYVTAPAQSLARKPATLGYPQSAALPLAALTAWQALVDHGRIGQGRHILVHGAGGAVGSCAVQLAVHLGATVSATASAADAEYVTSLGASTVVDYHGRFEDIFHDVDMVLDTVGASVMARSWSVMRAGGTLVSVVEEPGSQGPRPHNASGTFFIVEPNREQLATLVGLAESGALRVRVGRVVPLERAELAFVVPDKSRTPGKVVVEMLQEGVKSE